MCVHISKCEYVCGVNKQLQELYLRPCFLKQSCNWFEGHHFSWAGWPRSPGICLSLPPQAWDCKCAAPGVALSYLGFGDPAQVFAFAWQALCWSIFVLFSFCLAFVFCLFGWFCCHGLFVRFWDDRCVPPHQASAVEIMPHWCLQDRGWSGWGGRCHLLLCI